MFINLLHRYLSIARAALAQERLGPKLMPRTADELAFLPGALEIVETPPSPAGRATSWLVMGMCTAGLMWAVIGQLDIHATAQGRMVPAGKTKVMGPTEVTTVRAIHVRDGDRVRRDDLLVELDGTFAVADQARLRRDFADWTLASVRLRALLSGQTHFEAPATLSADPDLLQTHRQMLLAKMQEHQAAVTSLSREQEQREAELRSVSADVRRLAETVPLLEERVRGKEELAAKGYSPRMDMLELKQELVDRRQQLEGARHRQEQAKAAIAAVVARQRQLEEQFRSEGLRDLTEAEQRASAAAQELAKAEQRHRLTQIRAPVDGVVQQLQVHTVGGVVKEGEPILAVVPEQGGLEIEAFLLNKDAGFVHEGQMVEVKVDAFPFTRYGTLEGEVVHVSRDVVQPQDVDARNTQQQNRAEERGPLYQVRIRPFFTSLMVDGKEEFVTAGMSVVAEIKTGRRRIIDYVLSPVTAHLNEAGRER